MNTSTTVIIGASATSSRNRQNGCTCCHPAPPVTTLPAILIFMSAGLNLALGLGWDQYSVFGPLKHFRFSWFIGVIAGTILSIPLTKFLPKKFTMLASSLLVLTGGILFTSAPYTNDALLVGRYLNGIAVGLATVTFLWHSSEIAVNSHRGSCLAIEQYALTVGIAVQMIYTSQWEPWDTFPANRLHGILDIIFGALAAPACLVRFIESPLDDLSKGDEAAALESLILLERSTAISAATTARCEELKVYMRDQADLTLMDSVKQGALPLVKMIIFRSMMLAFSYSLPLSVALNYGALMNSITWPAIVAGCLRIFGCFLAQLQVDYLGRKAPSLVCTVVIGGLLIGIGAICTSYLNLDDARSMSIVTSLCLLVQFFAGFFAPFTSAYMGEAFPLQVKPYGLAICVIVEQLIHIIVICTFVGLNCGVFLAPGIMVVVASVALCVTMPETRKTSLKEAQGRFRHLLHLKML